MIERGAALLVLGAVLSGCSGSDRGKSEHMIEQPRKTPEVQDASEVPGAVVIRPQHNPNMVYDPETKKVTDTATGELFGTRQEIRSGGIYAAGIKAADGSPVYEYELKYDENRNPDSTVKRTIWEVFWARRGDWMKRYPPFNDGDAIKRAEQEAKNDSLERLAEFLRAKHTGIYRTGGRPPEGEVVIVDRRMDDTRGERVW